VGGAAALALVALALLLTGAKLGGDSSDAASQARSVIEGNYYKPVDGQTLDRASIEGMTQALKHRYGDKFSRYYTPSQLRELHSHTSGEFSGVGLTVSQVKEGLRVATVFSHTPADRAGLARGDVITGVNGHSIKGLPIQVSTSRIKGRPGTTVRIRVRSATGGAVRWVTLERAAVRIPAADGSIRRVDGQRVGYLRFATFSQGAHAELQSTLERLYREGAQGIVLDLRGNGGGLLDEAVLSASLFVENGRIVSTESRTMGDHTYDATGDALDPHPIVVLINHDTASAAEILTAALEDHDLGTLVGTRTFGKGTVQEDFQLSGGGALHLTVAEYLTADGSSIAGKGIPPQIYAKDNPRTKPDEALRQGLAVLGRMLSTGR